MNTISRSIQADCQMYAAPCVLLDVEIRLESTKNQYNKSSRFGHSMISRCAKTADTTYERSPERLSSGISANESSVEEIYFHNSASVRLFSSDFDGMRVVHCRRKVIGAREDAIAEILLKEIDGSRNMSVCLG